MKNVVHRTREEIVKNWVAALRSGKYEQTVGALRDDQGFCCLGVLCDLNRKDGGAAWVKKWGDDYRYRSEQSMLPEDMKKFIRGNTSADFNRYAAMNDEGASFSVLADKIEKELL